MVLPFSVLFLAAIPGTSAAQEGVTGVFWRALVLGTVLSLLIDALGGRLLRSAQARGWISQEWAQRYVPDVTVDGSGFIAAWVAGFARGFALRRFRVTRTDAEPQDGPDRTADFTEHLGGSWPRSACWTSGRRCSVRHGRT
ncbi:hypothetical protein ABZV24_01005 [Streptomyces sp. NPDC005251]|uniref:hypothetical protein n=1 Tax=Streptomyces sp. NPDC005251 TaxID=3157166 RepID=UPI0033AFE7AF